MGSLHEFPIEEKQQDAATSTRLVAAMAVALNRATATVAVNVHVIEHADANTRRLMLGILMDVVGRAAEQPDVTATQMLNALFELVQEGAA